MPHLPSGRGAPPVPDAELSTVPDAELSILTLPMFCDLALRLPYFDRYAAFPGFPGIAEQSFDPHRIDAFRDAM